MSGGFGVEATTPGVCHHRRMTSERVGGLALIVAAGPVDAVVSAAGRTARRKPLFELTDEDFALSIRHKLTGQVNVIAASVVAGYLCSRHSRTGTGAVLEPGA